ncbi:SRPBCC domain-containing protein [Labrenzia sp. OB1]|uniref:SRPBCC family protein n=1 Tax=Labrenzia sp. OB1 TaxID=1561204 RepID=UPI000838BD78|nr:SRPBCC domain-containing protein [Labrenzia sp. OB1]
MNGQNYKKSIRVNATKEAVFSALTGGIDKWWTSEAGKFEKLGDVAKFGFAGRDSYWSFKAMKLDPDLIEWECVEALHIHNGLPGEVEKEWLGTRTVWAIEEKDGVTDIQLEHQGLTPDLHCYEICEAGWDMFFLDSLKAYLDTGIGKPFS